MKKAVKSAWGVGGDVIPAIVRRDRVKNIVVGHIVTFGVLLIVSYALCKHSGYI